MDQHPIFQVRAPPDVNYAYEQHSLVMDDASGGFKVLLKWPPSLVSLHSFEGYGVLQDLTQIACEVLGSQGLEAIANAPYTETDFVPGVLHEAHGVRPQPTTNKRLFFLVEWQDTVETVGCLEQSTLEHVRTEILGNFGEEAWEDSVALRN